VPTSVLSVALTGDFQKLQLWATPPFATTHEQQAADSL